MWAFGVLFYFMLNIDFPFSKIAYHLEMNLHWPHARKMSELKKQAQKFSYTAAVK